MPREPEFLTVGDVAARLRVHPQTVRSWIAGGELRAIKIGRTVRIRRSDFEGALEREDCTGGPALGIGDAAGEIRASCPQLSAVVQACSAVSRQRCGTGR